MRWFVGAIAFVAFALSAAPASAAPPEPARQAWTRTGVVPTFLPEKDRLYVAAEFGTEQARAFVSINVPEAISGPVSLVVVESPGGSMGEGALSACPLTSPLVGSGELSKDSAPTADCSASVAAERGADGAWTVALDSFIPNWRGASARGVALVPTPGSQATFRLVFDVARTAVVAPVSAPPAPAAPPQEPAATEPGPPGTVPPAAPSTTIAPPPPMAGGASSAAPPVAPPAPVPSTTAPVATTTPGQVAPRPALPAAPIAVATAPSAPRSASSPPAPVVLGVIALGLAGAAVLLARTRSSAAAGAGNPVARGAGVVVASFALGLLPLLLAEATVYKLGLVLIVIVGAAGLHLLVNWAGELSLAHATMVGLPAFVVAKLSADHDISPILLVPAAVAIGALTGAVVGLPAIRAKGLQVALVTLAAGVAIDRFFFTKTWLVGASAGAAVDTPRLGPISFTTARSLYPVLVVAVIAAIGAAWLLYRSKIVRGLLWIKADASAAAAFGIPVARYQTMAYAMAGAFAGFAGGLTAMWVQRLTPQAFPLSRSFAYLIIVALAGRGFLGGVACAALMLEGGRLFLANGDALLVYAGPIGLIITITRNRDGLNGVGRQLAALLKPRREQSMTSPAPGSGPVIAIRPLNLIGVVLAGLGVAAIGLAWYHAGNTAEVWVQNQELISGGIGGLALVLIGLTLVVYDRIAADRAVTELRWERVIAALEARPVPPVEAPVVNGSRPVETAPAEMAAT